MHPFDEFINGIKQETMNEGLNRTGTIKAIMPVEKGQKKDGSGEWQKITFTLETTEAYNNKYAFEIFGAEKVEAFKKYNKVGGEVKVDFNISRNEYNGKFYITLAAWKVFKAESEVVTQAPSQNVPATALIADNKEDLPF
jgi:hypothetical protein